MNQSLTDHIYNFHCEVGQQKGTGCVSLSGWVGGWVGGRAGGRASVRASERVSESWVDDE